MGQSKSNEQQTPPKLRMPKRHFTTEFFVGVFAMAAIAAAGYLAIGLGDVEIIGSSKYELKAEFDNVSGLKEGASVEIAGVQVGSVSRIELSDWMALVTLRLDPSIKIQDDDIASIRTKGIIGDRFVKISRGASGNFINEGGTITETESAVDIEDIIGKIVHSMTGEKEDKPAAGAKNEKADDTGKTE